MNTSQVKEFEYTVRLDNRSYEVIVHDNWIHVYDASGMEVTHPV